MVTRHTEGKEQPISTEQAGSKSKYTPENLIPMFRKAAKFRDEMVELEVTDNGGAFIAPNVSWTYLDRG